MRTTISYVALACAILTFAACGSVTEDPSCETLSCGANASCAMVDGEATCQCDAAFEGDGQTCTDIDECATNTDDCADVGAECTNLQGSHNCACIAGFDGDGLTCDDVDECALATDNCFDNLGCTNNVGGFDCACPMGLFGDGIACTQASVTPDFGVVTDNVTISGAGFGATQGTITVDGVSALVTSWSDTSIVVPIPDVMPGLVSIEISPTASPAGSLPFTVVLPPKLYVHSGASIANGNASVVILDFDPTTGELVETLPQVELGTSDSGWGGYCAEQMLLHRSTRRLFVTSSTALNVFDINPATGELTPVTNSPLAVGSLAFGVSVTDAGDRALVTSFSTSTATVIDVAVDGTLTIAAGSPTATISGSTHTQLSGDGLFAYANSPTNMASYSVAADGSMAELATSPLVNRGGSTYTLHRRPGGNQIYVPDGSGFEAVSFDAVTGELTALVGSPFTHVTTRQAGTAFSPDGNRMFMRDADAANVAVYDLAADGTPTPVANSPFAMTGAVTNDACMRMTQDSVHLFVGSEAGPIAVFTVDAAGAPTAVPNSPFALVTTGTSSNSIATSW